MDVGRVGTATLLDSPFFNPRPMKGDDAELAVTPNPTSDEEVELDTVGFPAGGKRDGGDTSALSSDINEEALGGSTTVLDTGENVGGFARGCRLGLQLSERNLEKASKLTGKKDEDEVAAGAIPDAGVDDVASFGPPKDHPVGTSSAIPLLLAHVFNSASSASAFSSSAPSSSSMAKRLGRLSVPPLGRRGADEA